MQGRQARAAPNSFESSSQNSTPRHHLRPIELIVNGDDFGASHEVNDAIIRAHQEGILTSCSLLVTGEAFAEAVHLAKQNERLAVGIHLAAIKGRAVLPPAKIPLLVSGDGRFADNPTTAGFKYYFIAAARSQLKAELKAQFEKFLQTGLTLSHIDSHLHMHVHPVIFRAALELGLEFGVKRMRTPRDDFGFIHRSNKKLAVQCLVPATIFKLLCSRMENALKIAGFVFPQRVYGHFHSGRITEEVVLTMLEAMRRPSNELYFHPAIYPPEQALDAEQLQCKREFDILTSPRVKVKLAERGIQLTTYARL